MRRSRTGEKGDVGKSQVLKQKIAELGDDVNPVVRAFSYFLHLSNIAEDRDQNRRQRQYLLSNATPLRGGLPHALELLKNNGVSTEQIAAYLPSFCVVPVLTAHPTEVQRKSTLDVHRAIAAVLAQSDQELTPAEQDHQNQRMAGLIATLWHTRMLRRHTLTVMDEIETHCRITAVPS